MASDIDKLSTCKRGSWRLAGLSCAALLAAAGALGTAPAQAGDDGNPFSNSFNSMLGFIGVQNGAKPEAAIDYRPRPQIVVPPSRDLPAPQQKSAHGGDWPNDPDAVARRKAEADSRRPAPFVATTTPADAPSMVVRMTDCPPDKPQCTVDDSFWGKIQGVFGGGGTKEVVLRGVEPNRDYLVEPPVGYRAPVQMTQPVPPPPQQHKEARQGQGQPGVTQASDGNAKPADAPQQQPAPPPKEHFGLW
jgi:hypothetical protein